MNKYHKICKIGKGSSGDVILVKGKVASNQNKLFAIKRVDLYDMEKKGNVPNPLNETNLLLSLSHPNIIKCFHYFNDKNRFCIVLEYADNNDLSSQVKEYKACKKHIPEELIMDWLSQLCLAIKYLHSKNILHRDIKIHNVFLMKDGMIKLGDFGISKKLENGQYALTSLGTPYYLSPEICKSQPYYYSSDIWMLGCLLYELCTLEKPFQGSIITEVINHILYDDPKPISSYYSTFLCDLVQSLLKKNHMKRPSIDDLLNLPEIMKYIKINYQKFSKNYENNDIKEHTSNGLTNKNPSNHMKIETIERNDKDKNGLNEKFSQNSINYLIQTKKKIINKRNSEVIEQTPQNFDSKMQSSCDLVSDKNEIHEEFKEDYVQEKLSILEMEPSKNQTKKTIPKPLTIENKGVSSSKKSPNSALLDQREPISPNRTILFYDFLKTKYGDAKFKEITLIIEKYNKINDNNKEKNIEKEDYEKIKELTGENDAAYIVKFLRFILKLTPKASNFNLGIMGNNANKFDFSISPKETQNE